VSVPVLRHVDCSSDNQRIRLDAILLLVLPHCGANRGLLCPIRAGHRSRSDKQLASIDASETHLIRAHPSRVPGYIDFRDELSRLPAATFPHRKPRCGRRQRVLLAFAEPCVLPPSQLRKSARPEKSLEGAPFFFALMHPLRHASALMMFSATCAITSTVKTKQSQAPLQLPQRASVSRH
jgi:hypothetical protein